MRLLATDALAHRRHQHLGGGQEGQVAVQLGGDHHRVCPEVGQHGEEGLEQPVECEERVRQRHPAHHRAADVALVPLVAGQLADHREVPANHHRQSVDPLAAAGVHLVRHRGTANLALLETFGDQVVAGHQPDAGCHVGRRCRGLGERTDDVQVERAWVDLAGRFQDVGEPETGRDPSLQFVQFVEVTTEQVQHVLAGTHRALDAAHGIASDQVIEPGMRDQQFVGAGGEPLSEGGHLGGDVVAAADDRLVGVSDREVGQPGEHRHHPGTDQLQRLQHLHLLDVLGQIAAGHALVDVFMADQPVELLDPGLDVVPGDPLPIGDRV